MKSNLNKLGSSLLIIILLIMFSCKKDIKDISPDQPSQMKSMSDMKASSDFNWKTTQKVELQLTATVRSSLVIKSSSGIVYQKALLAANQAYNTAITIPNYTQELTFVVNGVSYILKIENNRVVHSF